MTDENTSAPAEWLAALPEQLRDAPFLGKASSPEDAVQKLAHAAKLVGTSIRIPSEDASDDDREAFYNKLAEVPGVAKLPLSDDEEGMAALLSKLGAPETPEGYKPPELEDFSWDETTFNNLRKYAKDAGMTTAQFNKFAKQLAQEQQQSSQEQQQAAEEARKALRLDWGDTLEDREALIRGWMDKSEAPEDLRNMLDSRSLPLETMKWLHEVAKQFKGEVNPISKDREATKVVIDPAEAREKIATTLQDMTNMSPADPRYQDLQRKLIEYHRLANAGQAA